MTRLLIRVAIPGLLSGAMAWCTWTTKTLYQQNKDLAILTQDVAYIRTAVEKLTKKKEIASNDYTPDQP